MRVKTYDGYKKSERPIEFQLKGRSIKVQSVLDQWYQPGETYFKVMASDGNVYILKRSVDDEWSLASYRRELVPIRKVWRGTDEFPIRK